MPDTEMTLMKMTVHEVRIYKGPQDLKNGGSAPPPLGHSSLTMVFWRVILETRVLLRGVAPPPFLPVINVFQRSSHREQAFNECILGWVNIC